MMELRGEFGSGAEGAGHPFVADSCLLAASTAAFVCSRVRDRHADCQFRAGCQEFDAPWRSIEWVLSLSRSSGVSSGSLSWVRLNEWIYAWFLRFPAAAGIVAR